jgi:nicotinate-nucleotide pyrophosphorylase (carboxylating)
LISPRTRALIEMALSEDIGHGDVTSLATVPADATAVASLVARSPLIVSGLEVALEVFRTVDPTLEISTHAEDGDWMPEPAAIATISGSARSILTAERSALNFIQHLSGVATLTDQYVMAVQELPAIIVDTRKTTPGFRELDKAAVRHGGGANHRFGLDDGILIKDNHIVAAGGLTAAVTAAQQEGGYLLRVEVECDTLDQVREALAARADMVLLDNMSNDELRQAVALCAGHAVAEASGGVNLQTVRGIAETGVDFISVGALTHSAPAADLALDF